jgi:hypothetical protein
MERMTRNEAWSYFEHTLTSAVVAEKGKMACIDTATGLVTKGGTSTTLLPVGYFEESKTGDGTAKVRVRFFRERRLHRWDNSGTDAVAAADIGNLCYVEDDTTVAATDGTSTLSPAGRVFAVTTDHVLVEMADSPTGATA